MSFHQRVFLAAVIAATGFTLSMALGLVLATQVADSPSVLTTESAFAADRCSVQSFTGGCPNPRTVYRPQPSGCSWTQYRRVTFDIWACATGTCALGPSTVITVTAYNDNPSYLTSTVLATLVMSPNDPDDDDETSAWDHFTEGSMCFDNGGATPYPTYFSFTVSGSGCGTEDVEVTYCCVDDNCFS